LAEVSTHWILESVRLALPRKSFYPSICSKFLSALEFEQQKWKASLNLLAIKVSKRKARIQALRTSSRRTKTLACSSRSSHRTHLPFDHLCTDKRKMAHQDFSAT